MGAADVQRGGMDGGWEAGTGTTTGGVIGHQPGHPPLPIAPPDGAHCIRGKFRLLGDGAERGTGQMTLDDVLPYRTRYCAGHGLPPIG
jgi:hypothetical protein